MYIDELIEIAVNDDPIGDSDFSESENFRGYYTQHNANFNVIGLTDAAGNLVERYEYTPYGQRQVYKSAGTNDPDAHAPLHISSRVEVAGIAQPYALNPIGHQGLLHDEATGLVYNRARMLNPRLQRFNQRDPLNRNKAGGGYQDGTNTYAYVRSNSLMYNDPHGTDAVNVSPESAVGMPWYDLDLIGQADAYGAVFVCFKLTGECHCPEGETKWRMKTAELEVRIFNVVDVKKTRKDGKDIRDIYGHEQRHVSVIHSQFSSNEELKEHLKRLTKDIKFPTQKACEVARDKLTIGGTGKQVEKIAKDAGQHGDGAKDDPRPEPAKEYPPLEREFPDATPGTPGDSLTPHENGTLRGWYCTNPLHKNSLQPAEKIWPRTQVTK